MGPTTLDYWTPLSPGDQDPCYEDAPNEEDCERWCNEISPVGSWFCSRVPGHPGPHVASDSDEVLEVWGDGFPAELRLPEGF